MQPDRYQPYTLRHLETVPRLKALPEPIRHAVRVVAQVLPFKTNRYVVEELIDWDRVPDDPVFLLTFPQRGMLAPADFARVEAAMKRGDPAHLRAVVERIRWSLNPHPAGQVRHNVPRLDGERLPGMQHKYAETVLFFPGQGQTCHAYCTFCFRWPQFVGMEGLKFAAREADSLVAYLGRHPRVSDVLVTGGDPLVMKADVLAAYLEPLLCADLPGLTTLRIGTKALTFWPYRFLTDPDADDLLRLFERVVASGRQLAVMAHFNHPAELDTPAAARAVARIRATGAQIRTQAPLLAHINDDAAAWGELWRRQTALGMVPYYMFLPRDTGARDYFAVPLVRAWRIFRDAFAGVSGLARTVRGPSMSTDHGKVQVLGEARVAGERVLALNLLQARDPAWTGRPFFARYDPAAVWLDDLEPAFGEDRFFFESDAEDPAPAGRAGPGPFVELA